LAFCSHSIFIAYKIWVGKPEGKRPLGIPRHRWKDITMDLEKWSGKV
jgi:hypothetical protein